MVVTATGVTNRLAEHALTLQFDALPPEVVQQTKGLFMDFLAVALGGRQVAESSAPIMQGMVDLTGGAKGKSTVLGEADLYPAHYAAMMNATLAHSMDYDDTHRVAIMHTGAPMFATLLALGEEYSVSGKEFLTAAVAGYDIANKIGKAHGPSMHHRGFHPTATTGIFACTAAGARLMDLTEKQTANAMGLNGSQTAGSQQFLVDGAWNKRLHTGLTAHNAILSLVMARHGYFGGSGPIEGKFGYFNLYTNDDRDPSAALVGLGSEWEVMNMAVKPYPCCRYNHATIDAVRDIVQEQGLSPSDVSAINIEMGPTGYNLVASPPNEKKRPGNIVEGQFSVYFAAAAAVLDPYTWDSYRLLGSSETERLMDVTTVGFDDSDDTMGSRVEVVAADGRRTRRAVPLPKGEPENPMPWSELEAKFAEWAKGVIGPEKTAAVAASIAGLEGLGSIRELTNDLRPA